MIKIGIVGNTGYIAKELIKFLNNKDFEIIQIGRSGNFDIFLDLNNPYEIDYNQFKILDFIIFTAAISSPDICTKEYEKAWNINVVGTKYVIKELQRRKIKVLFFSSDSVYGKSETDIFTEESLPNPFTPYGKMKEEIEKTFNGSSLFKSIRLSYVVSIEDKFTSYCINKYKNNETAEIFHPFYRNCIVLEDVKNIILWLINNWSDFSPNVLNVCGDELISRVRIVDEINRYLGNKLKYTIISPNDSFFESRPRITQLKSIYLHKYNIINEENFSLKINKELRSIVL